MPNRTVRVTSVAVEGVTTFPPPQVASHAEGLVGPAVPLQQIDAARQAILQEYRSAGYVLTTVSASLDAAGQLRFIVTEGRIASVKLDGDIGSAGVQVLRFLNRLTEHTPINAATLERYLLLAQDVPGVSVQAVLQSSEEEPGALNLIAQVSRRPVSGLVSFDNRAFDQTGPVEGLAVLDVNSLTEFGEKSELSYYHTFPNSQNFGQIAEEFFIGGSGLKARFYAGEGLAVPTGGGSSGLAVLDYHGVTQVLGAAVSYPVIRSRQQTLNLVLSLDALNSLVNDNQSPNGGYGQATFDAVRVLRLAGEYALSDIWLGAQRAASNLLTVRLSKGLPGLGASQNGSPGLPRPGEVMNFFKVNFEASRTQTLFDPWEGASVALMGLLTGQWSDDVLPPAEQFYLGGARFTRGYYSGQVPGDKALAATVELQLNTGRDVRLFGLTADISAQYYLFYDWGETWQNEPGIAAAQIASTGGGVRLQVTRYTEIDFEALARFNLYPTGKGSGASSTAALNGIGLYWRVLGRF